MEGLEVFQGIRPFGCHKEWTGDRTIPEPAPIAGERGQEEGAWLRKASVWGVEAEGSGRWGLGNGKDGVHSLADILLWAGVRGSGRGRLRAFWPFLQAERVGENVQRICTVYEVH